MCNFYWLKRLLFLLVLTLSYHFSYGSGLKGRVVDLDGNAVPGTSVFVKETHMGVTSNNDGYYELRLDIGSYTVIFQAMGFAKQEFKINVREDRWLELDIEFYPVQFQLQEVRIYSGGEDPAYAMMRRAIGLAPYYLRLAERYEAEVYLRGSLEMKKIPRLLRNRLSVNDIQVQPEDTYTQESMNLIKFAAPDTVHHTVIHSQSTFPIAEETTPIGYIGSSFYDPNNEMFVSPLSPQAMRHYRFRYEGYISEGGHIINRIRVIPRRKSQQLVEGDIYLVEGLWNIHSLDFTLEAFYGEVRMRQVYSPVQHGIWLPISHHFDLDVSIMGLQAAVNYIGSVKYLKVEPNNLLAVPEILASQMNASNTVDVGLLDEEKPKEVEPTRNQQRIETLMAKEELSNRDMMRLASMVERESRSREQVESLEIERTYHVHVKQDSLKQDSIDWNRLRPVPLTRHEARSFAVRDSLKAVADTTRTDTTKSVSGFTRARKFVMWGGNVPREGDFQVHYGGLTNLRGIGFNAVDGWRYRQSVDFRWQQDSLHRMVINTNIGYAFNRKALFGEMGIRQNYQPLRRGLLTIEAGSGAYDYKRTRGVAPLLNMASSLLFKENYSRFYENDFVSLRNKIDIANGLRLTTGLAWHQYNPLENSTNYSFFYQDRDYHANDITNSSVAGEHFDSQKAFVSRLELEYTPRYYYRINNGRKIMSHSDYPTFTLGVEHGSKILGSHSDYLLLESSIRKEAEFSFMPVFSWEVSGGTFLRNEQMHFSRFKHFEGSKIPAVFSNPGNSLMLLDDYSTSTNEWFVRANTTYSSPWLLLKNLPVLSSRMWNENLHFNYLHTPQISHYTQIGYSISRIFMAGTIGAFAGFSEGKYQHWGVRVAIVGW
ncbi:DUF5686 and carboxypeptidase regulatory-like domain-containing protein [Alkalitalea saponilacus]|uniref:CarboxypepD_reg-like domain-containing protein n=1 Tax=Alkalitalea saponilacus TaxID=889453 RepID=A0A1T5AT39_9BACT|nr:DUF5686 and carboxypeptidase regulatory-like domain-containing protein [Alkalitalea saponilacus]ASB48603.1 hypothetical protein CDL62_05335 [Alkalitalea saponilacus]SKB38182.1 CarboxypepD_reg-like domain-containing protein [Alkalitalea saponilacus]